MSNMKPKWTRILSMTATAAAVVLTIACGQPAQQTEAEPVEASPVVEAPVIDDATIQAEVQSKLSNDPELAIFTVEAEATGGVVTLRGQVESEEAWTMAEQRAANTAGVESVDNQLEVVAAGKAKGRISDAWITTKVKSKLAADPQVNPFNIDVDTKNRVVTLSGEVKTDLARSEAEKHAADTRAVRSVVNELTVDPEAEGEARGAA